VSGSGLGVSSAFSGGMGSDSVVPTVTITSASGMVLRLYASTRRDDRQTDT
jgi:hypothetical protein